MSRLSELLRQARKADLQLGADLEAEVTALTKRRTFGLVFEAHQPEAVELPGRPVRRGDKVRVLPPRGVAEREDQRLWRVIRIERTEVGRFAHLSELGSEEPVAQVVGVDELSVVAEFRDRIHPGLVETGRVERGGNKPFHTVINSENYHALEMLTYTHRHSIDAIYIDPPYNSGASDWKYNNNYVGKEDDYRHSKWLAFIERRLKLARELLNPSDSALVVTIDEKEYLRLGLLLEQTYPEAKIQMISTVINPAGTGRANELSRTDEYVFLVRFGAHQLAPELVEESKDKEVHWPTFRRAETSSARPNRPSQFYPIFVDVGARKIVEVGHPLAPDVDRFSIIPPVDCVAVFPVRDDGTEMNWGLTRNSLVSRLERGYVRLGGYDPDHHQPFVIKYLKSGPIRDIESGKAKVRGYREDGSVMAFYEEGKTKMPTTQWRKPSHDAYRHGTTLLRDLYGQQRFPFPKSLYAVEDVLRLVVGNKPEAVVLDFFAGSGTTAHAVFRLNKQDGGCRHSIMVTNNEVSAAEQKALRLSGLRPGDREWEALGICEYVTKPRLVAALTGETASGEPVQGKYKFVDEFPLMQGFQENVAFFKLTYESPLSVRHHRAFRRIATMLWIRAGSRGRLIDSLGEDGWDVAEAYGVLRNLDQTDGFINAIGRADAASTAFVVTDDEGAFQMVCRELPSTVTPIRLYETYLQNFQINMGGN